MQEERQVMGDLSERSETQQWKSGQKKDTLLLRDTVSSLGTALLPSTSEQDKKDFIV